MKITYRKRERRRTYIENKYLSAEKREERNKTREYLSLYRQIKREAARQNVAGNKDNADNSTLDSCGYKSAQHESRDRFKDETKF